MSREIVPLLLEARRLLNVPSQGDFGELLGSSRRTGQRWEAEGSVPTHDQLAELAGMVHPLDASLAARIAAYMGTSLVALGIVPPPAPPAPPPAPPPLPDEDMADSVVCAAAEAMNMVPRDVRPGIRAAFTRARRLRLSVEAVERGLGGPPPDARAAPAGKSQK